MMGRLFGLLAKGGSILTGLGVFGAGAAATENYINGENSFTQRFLTDTFAGVARSQNDAGVQAGFEGFYKFVEMIAQMIQRSFGEEGPISNAIGNWAQRNMGVPETFGNGDPNDNTTPVRTVSVGQSPDVTQSAQLDWGDGASVAVAGTAAAVGVRAIPVLASFAAAADGLWDTGAYVLNGEFGNAATRFAGGAVETVGGLGGFLTYAFGVAGREGIENVSNHTFGTNVPDGEIVSAAKNVYGFLTNG